VATTAYATKTAAATEGPWSSAAYFDVDGTLVDTNLLGPTAWFLLNQARPQESLIRFGRAILGGPAMAFAELRDRRLFNELLYANYKGISWDRMEVVGRDVFEDIVEPRIFRGAQELIDQCHIAGQRVVLVTGSLDHVIQHLAEYLGADAYITNRLEFKDGIATGKLMRPVVAGPEKAGIIVEDARIHDHDLAKCHGYSDSYSDVPMLSVVGHPNCIKPDAKLRQLARAYAWPVLDIDRAPSGGPR
jgi:HAD superfamily hydrolase (TIGR01490 family)